MSKLLEEGDVLGGKRYSTPELSKYSKDFNETEFWKHQANRCFEVRTHHISKQIEINKEQSLINKIRDVIY